MYLYFATDVVISWVDDENGREDGAAGIVNDGFCGLVPNERLRWVEDRDR